jgi:flagellar biosynthesis protein FlhG
LPRPLHDQAEGLRRLLDRNRLRVVSVSAGGAGGGKTGAVINLAGALAELGKDVLILDENPAAQGVIAALGLNPRFDMEHVIRRERDLDEVIVRGPAGIRILPLARGTRSLAQLDARDQQWLLQRCGRLAFPVDTLLVDAAPGGAGALLWPGSAAEEVVVLAGGSATAITAAYARIKQLAGEFARREFHILVSSVASEAEARAIFGNIARVARRYLQVSLHFMGHIPPDDKLRHAARLRLPVVAAFPGAAASAGFRRLAQAISGWPRAEEDGSGFDDFMRRLIHSGRQHTAAAQSSL